MREQELVGHLVRKHRKLNSSKKSKSSSSGSHLSSSKKSGKKGGKKNGDMPTDAPTIPAQDIAVYSTSLSGAAEVPAPVETDVGGSITLMTREDSTGMIFNLKIDNPSGVPILGVAGAHVSMYIFMIPFAQILQEEQEVGVMKEDVTCLLFH